MPFFTKKPVTVEARQYDGSIAKAEELTAWIEAHGGQARYSVTHDGSQFFIATLEGNHEAAAGDWIIKGIKGEFYPCKPDIFLLTYTAAQD
jgi:hypothetical protein